MKEKSIFSMKGHRNRGSFLEGLAALAMVAMLLLIPASAIAGDPGVSGPAGKSPVVTIEKIPGKEAPRVILSAKAAERLGIETGNVEEKVVPRKQMVGGLVVPRMEEQPKPKPADGVFGTFRRISTEPQPAMPRATLPAGGGLWVLVALSPGEWDRMAKDKPARLLPLATRDNFKKELWAKPSGIEPVENLKRSMLSVYYVVPGEDHGLTVNNRVRVELPLSGTDQKQKVVPYSAVHYDGQGNAWVYLNTKPLTYERQRIRVERVVGDLAILSDGPAIGTPVVTVGAPLLHGAELFKK